MKPVSIHIYSQSYGSDSQEQMKTLAYGKLTEKNNKFYAFYDESEESGLLGTKTTIKWDDDRVIILRNGSVNSRQEFAEGLTDESVYKTPYIMLSMKTITDYMYVYRLEKTWHIELKYSLEIGGEPQNKMHLKITIEEDIKREYEGSVSDCH